jgi:peptidoglycan/LPS O-acetylase OafA/YrhL
MGVIRLMLAFGVLLAHIEHQIMPAVHAHADFRLTFGIIGGHSVLWFYVVSGFLMSTVLDTKYGRDTTGTIAFFKARALRIFPLWIAIFLFCAIVIAPSGGASWITQHSPLDIVRALVLVGQDWRLIFSDYPKPNWSVFAPASEVSWTLGAELTFYLIAPFVLRSRRWCAFLFLTSVCIRIGVIALTAPGSVDRVTWNYFFFPSTLCFFLLGHLSRFITGKLPNAAGFVLLAAALSCSFPLGLDPSRPFDNPWFYAATLLFAGALPGVFTASKDLRASNFLGDLTYPLYLVGNICLASLFATWSWRVSDLGAALLHIAASITDDLTRGYVITALVAGFALLVAMIVRFVVEVPATAILRRRLFGPTLPSGDTLSKEVA